MKHNKEEKNRKIIIICLVLLFSLFLTTIYALVVQMSRKELTINTVSTESNISGCRTIKVKDSNKIEEYSFDNGQTWQKSNYHVVCNTKTIKILGRNTKKNIVAKGEITLKNIDKNYPKILIDFEKIINNFDDQSLLDGVKATNNEIDLTEKIIIEDKVIDDDLLIVTYSVTNEKGQKTTVKREVEISKSNEIILYDKKSYTCQVGEKLETNITIIPSSKQKTTTIESFNSSSINIASVYKNPNYTLKTPNKIAVIIDCKIAGKTKLNATSSNGTKTSVDLTVTKKTESKEIIAFEKTSYTCKVGDKIQTTISATSNSVKSVGISSYNSLNTNIATIDKDPHIAIKTPSIKAVLIECKKAGTTTLNAESTTGAKTSVKVTVEEKAKTKETIAFEKTSYTCKVGDEIATEIHATSESELSVGISSFTSSNTAIATIAKSPYSEIRSPNAKAVLIKCKKAGTTTLNAESTTGAKTSVKVTVEEKIKPKETIKFNKTSYTCNVGDEISTEIHATSESDFSVGVSTFTSSNTSIATIEKSPYYDIRSPNAKAVLIKCKKAGTTTLNTESTTGAKGTAKIIVTENQDPNEKISFEKTSYTCKIGETISTSISATSDFDSLVKISSYDSSNTNIATIGKENSLIIGLSENQQVLITCKNAGTTTLNASTSRGKKTSVNITVTS